MNRNNMSKKQRRESEATGYRQRYQNTPASRSDFTARNECVTTGRGVNDAHTASPSASYKIESGRSLRNMLKISGVKSHA